MNLTGGCRGGNRIPFYSLTNAFQPNLATLKKLCNLLDKNFQGGVSINVASTKSKKVPKKFSKRVSEGGAIDWRQHSSTRNNHCKNNAFSSFFIGCARHGTFGIKYLKTISSKMLYFFVKHFARKKLPVRHSGWPH